MRLIVSYLFKDPNNSYVFVIPNEYMEGEICKKNNSLELLSDNDIYVKKDGENRNIIHCKLCATLKPCAELIEEDVLRKSKFISIEIRIRVYYFNGRYGKCLDITSLTNI